LITLSIQPYLLPPRNSPTLKPIWSVFIKDDDIQVERPYTPLFPPDDDGRLTLWIKQYPHGEVGQWLHSKGVGDIIELRGPLETWQWKEDVWDEIIMVCVALTIMTSSHESKVSGGTGITPFFQLLNSELARDDQESSKTRFTLLHSSRTPVDLPPPTILDPLLSYTASRPDRFRLRLFVDELDSLHRKYDLQVGRIGKNVIEQSLGLCRETGFWRRIFRKPALETTRSVNSKDRKILFLVCGPPG
jgi:cytochrome-b5 reductase